MSLLFSPWQIGSLKLHNRLVMSPMQQYRGDPEGHASAYHVHHYARVARGGVGLVMVESTAVASDGRLFADDIGIFSDDHVPGLKAVVDAVHAQGAAIGIQLCHGGRKTTPRPEIEIMAPSAIAFDDAYGTPRAMSLADIARVRDDFAAAAVRSIEAGFDTIQIHAAHGYLIHQFLSPLSNTRDDDYGGTPEKRGRFLREVYAAVRKAVGPDYPLFVRVSASDFAVDGLTPAQVVDHLRPLLDMGLAAVDVSAGGLLPVMPPNIGPEYQVPYASEIRQALGVPVMAVGLIRNAAGAEAILASERADFIAIGRPFLERPDYAKDWPRKLA